MVDARPGDWRQMLRAARKALKVDQATLAQAAGISAEAVKSYENGRRDPKREHLEALLLALKVPNDEANAIREGLGFTPVMFHFTREFAPDFFFTLDELPAVVEETPWPQFVVNDAFEIVAGNEAISAVWDIDFAYEKATRTRAQTNLLSIAGDHRFADRMKNWDEIIAMFVSIFKAPFPTSYSIDAPTPYFEGVVEEFLNGDPAFLAKLLDTWKATEPRRPRVRSAYRVVWEDHEFGEMRFRGVITNASYPDALSFNDWIPIDTESWRILEAVKGTYPARLAAHREKRA